MAYALCNYSKYRDAQDNAKVSGKSLLEEYKKLGGKIFEGTNAEVASYPKAEAIYDEEPVEPVKAKKAKKLGKVSKKLGKKK